LEIDPIELIDEPAEGRDSISERKKSRLNAHVAISIALLATFLGICKVKDDNIVQAMQQAQATELDSWNFYQARNLREEINRTAAAALQVQKLSQPPKVRAAYEQQIIQFQKTAQQQSAKKKEQRVAAKAARDKYDQLNFHDDQFDLSDALLAIAISMLAVTSLVQKRALFYAAIVPTFFGVLMGCAGLFGWRIHPDSITNLLSDHEIKQLHSQKFARLQPNHSLAKVQLGFKSQRNLKVCFDARHALE
jgi:Domain of unknown function (DUF4337)